MLQRINVSTIPAEKIINNYGSGLINYWNIKWQSEGGKGMNKKIRIHSYKESTSVTSYIFTKSKNQCLLIRYDKELDFGKTSSGVHLSDIEIHYYNSFKKDGLTEIGIEDVPEAIIDLLTYLND